MHAVVAVATPARPLFTSRFAPILDAYASFLARLTAPFTRVVTALPRRLALFLNRPVSLRLCKRGCRREHKSQSEDQSGLASHGGWDGRISEEVPLAGIRRF